jgi:hypothetical protein
MSKTAREPQTATATQPDPNALDIRALKEMSIADMTQVANELGVDGASSMRKQELIFKILQAPAADRAERPRLSRCRAGLTARRLRLPARSRVQLPARPRRHLRLAEPDPPLRPAHR